MKEDKRVIIIIIVVIVIIICVCVFSDKISFDCCRKES